MPKGRIALLTGAVLLLAGCSNTTQYREWTATEETPMAAFDDCAIEVDATMRLRGYPLRPLPETPQAAYRKEIFAQCMRRKGYKPD